MKYEIKYGDLLVDEIEAKNLDDAIDKIGDKIAINEAEE